MVKRAVLRLRERCSTAALILLRRLGGLRRRLGGLRRRLQANLRLTQVLGSPALRHVADRKSTAGRGAGAGVAAPWPSLSLLALPPEAVAIIVSFHRRGDPQTLASTVAASSATRSHCSPLLWRVVACRQCDAPFFHPRDILGRTPAGAFDDGPALAAASPTLASSLVAKEQGSSTRSWRCICSLKPSRTAARTSKKVQQAWELLEQSNIQAKWSHLLCGRCHLYIGERAVADSGATVSFVCQNYLRQLDSDGPCSEKPLPLFCTGARRQKGKGTCGQKLCDMQDVLSRRHCWAPPGGTLEDAWYVNGLVQDNVEVAVARAHHLAQGRMEVADVSCKACSAVVGWQFVTDLEARKCNRNQVGRFGLCVSSLRDTRGAVGPRQRAGEIDLISDILSSLSTESEDEEQSLRQEAEAEVVEEAEDAEETEENHEGEATSLQMDASNEDQVHRDAEEAEEAEQAEEAEETGDDGAANEEGAEEEQQEDSESTTQLTEDMGGPTEVNEGSSAAEA